jgi:hypothetical protein
LFADIDTCDEPAKALRHGNLRGARSVRIVRAAGRREKR